MKNNTDENKIILSVCLIVKNEAEVLDGCLADASRFADEIVVVDTGSTDDTKAISRRYTNQVYDYVWTDDFAAARNASFQRASGDYIMWLDADDRIDKENCRRISEWKQQARGKLISAGYEKPENGSFFLCPRVVRRDAGFVWDGIIHERLLPTEGPLKRADCVTADFVIRHCKKQDTDYRRNIRIMEKLPEASLKESFWLCGQCYFDCVMAGEEDKAGYYLRLAKASRTPFEERQNTYKLIHSVLKFHKKYEAMLRWNAMYLRDNRS